MSSIAYVREESFGGSNYDSLRGAKIIVAELRLLAVPLDALVVLSSPTPAPLGKPE